MKMLVDGNRSRKLKEIGILRITNVGSESHGSGSKVCRIIIWNKRRGIV